MPRSLKAPVAKPDNLGTVPGKNMIGGENIYVYQIYTQVGKPPLTHKIRFKNKY